MTKNLNDSENQDLKTLVFRLDNEKQVINVNIDNNHNLFLLYNFQIYRETSFQLLEKLEDIIKEEKIVNIIIDLNGTMHLDSIAVSTLISIKKLIDGDCKLVNANPSVIEIFEILNLDRLFIIKVK